LGYEKYSLLPSWVRKRKKRLLLFPRQVEGTMKAIRYEKKKEKKKTEKLYKRKEKQTKTNKS